jgi:glycerophosphoryl diester phosphodiesterase
VCVHDRDLRRIAGHQGVVSAMELATLHELDIASRRPSRELVDEDTDLDPELDGVLTLRRLFETVAACDRPVELAVETKHPTRYAGLVERRLVDLLQEFGWHQDGSPVRVMSFSYLALQRVQRLAPELRKVMLFEHARHWPVLRRLVEDDWVAGPWIDTLRKHPEFGRRLADSGREIHVWTVNTSAELQICLDFGVTAVITDKPAYMLELLGAP